MPAGGAERRPALRVAQQADDGVGEGARVIGAGVVAPVADAEAFGPFNYFSRSPLPERTA